MKLTLPLKITILFCCCCSTSLLIAQDGITDTTNTIAIQHALYAYHQSLVPQTNLYNGSEYVDYPYIINEGIPFFETEKFSTGSLVYNGVLYQDVPLLYDEIRGEVIIRDFYGRGKIKLNTENVAGFSLLQHRFVKLLPDSAGKSPVRAGFYEVLYQGNTEVYKKESKKILENISAAAGIRRTIDADNSYYIKKDNVFYVVNTKKSLLKITKDKKKEIQQFIRKNKLNLRVDKTGALVKVAAYYDQLTNQ